MIRRSLRSVLLGALALSGCTAPVVVEPHADVPTGMWNIASRFEQDRRQGGMAGVIADIEQCYASATGPVVKVYTLRDCLVLDYVGYRTDVTIGRRLWHQALPYFEDKAATARWTWYGMLAQFDTPTRLVEYLRNAEASVQLDLAQINAAPVIAHHPISPPLASHF